MEKKYKYIDLKYLNDITTNAEFKKKIFFMFKKEILILETGMKESLNKKDYSKLAEIVHKAKSNVSVLGMVKQTNEMKELETDIKEKGHIDTYETRVNNFLNDCHEALKEIVEIEKIL